MGFEPTEHFCSTAFKAVAITQTLPTLHVGAEMGFEPILYWLMRPVPLPLDYSAMARTLGVEPRIVESKSTVLPLHHVLM